MIKSLQKNVTWLKLLVNYVSLVVILIERVSMFILVCLFLASSVALAEGEFVVQKKKEKKLASASTLKEQLGSASRDALYSSSKVLRRIGGLQISLGKQIGAKPQKAENDQNQEGEGRLSAQEMRAVSRCLGKSTDTIASLYDYVSGIIERLINNEKCFKKAKRTELAQAVDCLNDVNEQLENCFAKNVVAHGCESAFQKDSVRLEKMIASMDTVSCLRNA